MAEWLKSLAGGLCILTVLLHLIPDGKFTKYVKFYAGLLFFLIAARPVIRFFAGDGELERLLRLEFVKEEHYDLQNAVEGMSELKNSQISAALKQEIVRQITEISAAYSLTAYDITLMFDEKDEYLLEGISFSASGGDNAAVEAVIQELSGVYALEEKEIRIFRQGG